MASPADLEETGTQTDPEETELTASIPEAAFVFDRAPAGGQEGALVMTRAGRARPLKAGRADAGEAPPEDEEGASACALRSIAALRVMRAPRPRPPPRRPSPRPLSQVRVPPHPPHHRTEVPTEPGRVRAHPARRCPVMIKACPLSAPYPLPPRELADTIRGGSRYADSEGAGHAGSVEKRRRGSGGRGQATPPPALQLAPQPEPPKAVAPPRPQARAPTPAKAVKTLTPAPAAGRQAAPPEAHSPPKRVAKPATPPSPPPGPAGPAAARAPQQAPRRAGRCAGASNHQKWPLLPARKADLEETGTQTGPLDSARGAQPRLSEPTTDRSFYPSFGRTCFFEVAFVNTYPHDDCVILSFDDLDLRCGGTPYPRGAGSCGTLTIGSGGLATPLEVVGLIPDRAAPSATR
eukprot:tig00000788_g4087.t1